MDPIVYIDCPRCQRRVTQPFVRTSGPVPHVHRRCGARLVVTPDPYRSRHRVVVVPSGQTLEEALRVELAGLRGRVA